ncbi:MULTISPECIES: hypothetical protein [unclassified Rhizobium]|uniref:hypothetical protein n=1 Tax=unclassified Rhizobium TaxID=2613769 RepID=UPI001ADACBFB|nr:MULTISPECIES: hypothetical protein [unclassified Rhizobium]MBO9122793.1 hypothetical protein [Rhizobium sp. 16-488-2b]MBO9173325.1 hypothetical protein [Rhizobium sp. 16-488-2a]
MAQIASLNVPMAPIPQPDFSWLDKLSDSIGGVIQKKGRDKALARLADEVGPSAGQPQPQQSFLSGLMGGNRQQAAAAPMTAPVGPVDRGPAQGSTYQPFIDTIRTKIQNPYALAAVAATGRAESGWSPQKAASSWADPSQSGQAGTSGGILSWRAERLQNLRNFARSRGEEGNGSPQTQAEYFLSEDPSLITRLNAAQSPEEAADLMAGAWRFAGYDQPGGEAARRRAMTTNYFAQDFRDAGGAPQAQTAAQAAANLPSPVNHANTQGNGTQVASLDPSIGIPLPGWAGPMRANDPARRLDAAPDAAPSSVATAGGDVPIAASQVNTGSPLPRPAQMASSAGSILAPGVTPVQRGGVDVNLIQRLLRDPQLNEVGLELWKANVQGQKASEPWQFITLPDGTLARANQQTGEVMSLGGFSKPQDPLKVGPDDVLLDPVTHQPIYKGSGEKPTNDIREYNYAQSQGFKGTFADWQTQNKKAGATVINTGDNSSKFAEESDKAAAKRLNDIVEAGAGSPQMMEDLQTLANLGRQIGTGKGAQVMNALGPYAEALGFSVEGLGESQAYDAIVSRLAPAMRPAGSGATSDFDARQFLKSLPSLGNSPEGNALIVDTFQRVQENRIKAADIASRAYLPKDAGGITWQEAEKQIRALANPYARFKQYANGNPQRGNPSPQTRAPRARNPQTGETLELRNGKWEPVR